MDLQRLAFNLRRISDPELCDRGGVTLKQRRLLVRRFGATGAATSARGRDFRGDVAVAEAKRQLAGRPGLLGARQQDISSIQDQCITARQYGLVADGREHLSKFA